MDFIKSEYKKEWQFFKGEMKLMFPIMLVLFIGLIVGSHYLYGAAYKYDPETLKIVAQTIDSAMGHIDLGEESALLSAVKLFFNNARASLMAISFGIIPFLFLPAISYFSNAIVVGMVTSMAQAIGGFNIGFFLASLLPHGIFEVPAIIYACALGIYLCKELSKIIIRKSGKRVNEVVIGTLRSYVLVILPLLVLAAVIESTLTIKIAMMFI